MEGEDPPGSTSRALPNPTGIKVAYVTRREIILAKKPIGRAPDLNDCVRLNIRSFVTAEVLRHNKKPKLNIAWDKDRGKDVETAPWSKVFKDNRINDYHLTQAEKRATHESKGI